jgi:hypothetical protein
MYFFAMKWMFVLFIALVSCNEQRSQPVPRPTLLPKDSNLLKTDSINPFAPIDVSPMDMSYFPSDYPVQKMSGNASGSPVMRVIYSRPHRQGRKIFGSLLKYGEPWRLGANEATEIEFFKPVTIQNKKIGKGKYVMYAIPYQDKWTVVLNSNLNTWGLKQEPKDDVFKFDIPVQVTDRVVEYFSMVFQKNDNGADLVMAWDTTVARLPIQF